MYKDFYGLTDRPFTLFPDPDYLYLAPQHKLALAYLEYGVKERAGFVVLTGEVGTGKTTLINSLLKTKDGNLRLGVIYQTALGAADLLELLLRVFKVRGHSPTRAARLDAFKQFLFSAHSQREYVVLVIDEAQNLGPEALEELRLLSNIQTEKEHLLQIILVGQSGLRQRLRHPTMRQLAQRVAVHYHLNPLNLQETKEYVRFRLARAGGTGIFTDSALEELYDRTKGVPRRLNVWCDLALVAGFAEGLQKLDGDFIDGVFQAQGGSLEGLEAEEAPADRALSPATMVPPLASDFGLRTLLAELSSRLNRLENLVLEMTTQLTPALVRALDRPQKVASTQRDQVLEPPGKKVVAEAAPEPKATPKLEVAPELEAGPEPMAGPESEAPMGLIEEVSEANGQILENAEKALSADLIPTPESSEARPYRPGKLGKTLMTGAGVVAVLVLGIILIKHGSWTDKIQSIYHKIHPATQTTAEQKNDSRRAELEKQVPAAPVKEATPKEKGQVPPKESKEPASSPAKSEDLGKPKELSLQLSRSTEPGKAPPSSPGPPVPAQIPSPPPEAKASIARNPITPEGESRPEALGSLQPRGEILGTQDELRKTEKISPQLPQPRETGGAPPSSPEPPTSARTSSLSLAQLTVKKGEIITQIVNRNYADDERLGLMALILGNPEIRNEDLIHPGQVLYLPRVNFDKKTIRLKDNLFYAIYERYPSSKDDKTSWLAEKKVRLVIRDTRNSRGNVVHRIFLGGYETEEELERALESLKATAK